MTKARPYHHGNLRETLLAAASRLFAERGRFDFTMRELARAAGVTHNAPYRHFADRWALLDALAAQGFDRLRDATVLAGEKARTPRTRLEHLGEAYVRFAVDNPDHFRLMFLRPLENASPELAAAARSSFAVLEAAIAGAAAAGQLRRDVRPVDLTLSAWALVHGLASLLVGGQLSASPRALRARVTALAAVFADGAFASAGRSR